MNADSIVPNGRSFCTFLLSDETDETADETADETVSNLVTI